MLPDAIYMLMFSGWRDEHMSNRWHMAKRWGRHAPVVLVQPELLDGEFEARSEIEPRIDNCRILSIRWNACNPETAALEAADQARQIMEDMRKNGYERTLLWLYNPWLSPLYCALPTVGRVMHYTEDWLRFPGMDDTFRQYVHTGLIASDLTIPVSSPIADTIIKLDHQFPVLTVTNGCDYSLFSGGKPDLEVDELGADFERIAVFCGNIDVRIDYDLLFKAIQALPNTLFLFAGRLGQLSDDDEITRAALLAHPNTFYLGVIPPERIPNIYASASVGMVPYKLEAYIVESNFSLKILELAAAGLPVVTSLMRALEGLAVGIRVTENHEDFIENLRTIDRSSLRDSDLNELRELARKNDYDAKFSDILENLEATLFSGDVEPSFKPEGLIGSDLLTRDRVEQLLDFCSQQYELRKDVWRTRLWPADRRRHEAPPIYSGEIGAEIVFERARIVDRSGNWRGAHKIIKRLVREFERHPQSIIHLVIQALAYMAKSYLRRGDKKSARSTLRRAHKILSKHASLDEATMAETNPLLIELRTIEADCAD